MDDVAAEQEDPEFERWYGAWDPLHPAGAAALLDGLDRPWWIVGGWAIEAFTGMPREHEDLDVSLLSSDVPALREAVGATEPADHPWRQLLTPGGVGGPDQ